MYLILSKLKRLLNEPVLSKKFRASIVISVLYVSLLAENKAIEKKQKLNRMLDEFINQVSKKGES